jgi:hypothetical protein
MPIIKQVKGDAIEMFKKHEISILIHEINCVKKLEEDFSKEMVNNFPEILEVDNEFPLPALYRLGDYSVVNTEYGNILNFYTKLLPNSEFEFTALKNCLKKISMEAIRSGNYIELAFPVTEEASKHPNWETVKKILNFQEHLLITVISHDKGQVPMGEEEINSPS